MRDKLDQFMVDADKMLETADTLSHSGLFADDNGDPIIGINNEAWSRYKSILRCLVAAKDAGGWNVLDIRYDKSPSMTENYAAITLKMQGACAFSPAAKTALAMAAAASDRVATTMRDNVTRLSFVVGNLWPDEGGM